METNVWSTLTYGRRSGAGGGEASLPNTATTRRWKNSRKTVHTLQYKCNVLKNYGKKAMLNQQKN